MEMVTAFLGGAAAAAVVAVIAFLRFDRRRLKAERAAEERARRAERSAYASRLAGGLIHEIKNPLNTLSLNLQLLAEDCAGAETHVERRALKRIQRLQGETKRLNAILDDFMGFVRDRKLDLAERDVNRLVDSVVTFVRPALESKGIHLRASYGAAPRCRVDENLIKQALLNLILNAEQALEERGTREIMVRTSGEGAEARIDVIDTGRGIRPGDEERIFEAFYSTRKGGTGLGLAATRRIVEEHGGSIEVHSDRGRGTCFTVRLPVGAEDAGASEGEGGG